MFKNRHILIALLIAPVLALIAWFSLDLMMGETPHAAVEGQSYPLVEMPNCRYESGSCKLKNEEFLLEFTPEWQSDGSLSLTLESAVALDGVKISVSADEAGAAEPQDMEQAREDGRLWALTVCCPNPSSDRIRLVASSRGTLYFGDASLSFTTGQD